MATCGESSTPSATLNTPLEDKVKARLQKKIIRYLPGTSHHKHDFEYVENFLSKLLENNPNYHLNIIGDLEFHDNNFPASQISKTAFQPYDLLPSLIDDSWLIIAPLTNNIFNHCKSGLKFWESAAFGIPVISSPLADMQRFNNKGLCISDKSDCWREFIRQMEDPETYLEASKAAVNAATLAITADSNTVNQPNYYHHYISLTAQFGPRWPADSLNPTSAKHSFIHYQQELLRSNEMTNTEDIQDIIDMAAIKTKADTPPKLNKTLRKTKKLFNSPGAFFKDMKVIRR